MSNIYIQPMGDLLTTKQVQDILKVDRITVYRMVDDGRIKGVKIGTQWRFTQNEIDRFLGLDAPEEVPAAESIQDFPSTCVKEVQDIFAGIIGIGAVTVTMQGTPLTEPTFTNPFCKLIMSSESGKHACQSSWRRIALKNTGEPDFQICHAGLCYKRAKIQSENHQIAWLIAGQYYLNNPENESERKRVEDLAVMHQISKEKLLEAARQIPILNKYQQDQVQEWTPKVAGTVQSILCERAELIGRLKRIAELSSINPSLTK